MTALLRKRLKRIEAEVIEPDATEKSHVAILIEPAKSDTAEKWADHRAKLEEAKRTAEMVYVVCFGRKKREEGPGNVIYEPFDIDTIGQIFAMKRGGKREFNSLMDDTLAGLHGNLIMPVGSTVTGNWNEDEYED